MKLSYFGQIPDIWGNSITSNGGDTKSAVRMRLSSKGVISTSIRAPSIGLLFRISNFFSFIIAISVYHNAQLTKSLYSQLFPLAHIRPQHRSIPSRAPTSGSMNNMLLYQNRMTQNGNHDGYSKNHSGTSNGPTPSMLTLTAVAKITNFKLARLQQVIQAISTQMANVQL